MIKRLLILLLLVCINAEAVIYLPIRTVASTTITPNVQVSTSSGVAPLTVWFRGDGTTDSGVTYPFHDDVHDWNFADDQSAFWAYGSNPGANNKNIAYGPVAAHTFELPGTYVVTYRVSNDTGSASITTTITVTDPAVVYSGTNTICVKQSGGNDCSTFGVSGASQQTVATGSCNTLTALIASGKRVLVEKGTVWTGCTAWNSGAMTNPTIGAYGSGLKPQYSFSSGGFNVSSGSATGVRFMDMKIIGNASAGAITADNANNPSKITILRVDVTNSSRAFGFDAAEVAVVDSTCASAPSNTSICFYVNQNGLTNSYAALLGSSLSLSTVSGFETTREVYMKYGVFSNSDISSASSTYALIKHHSCSVASATWCGNASQFNIFSDLKLIANGPALMVEIAPQNASASDHVVDIIYERNFTVENSLTFDQHYIQGQRISIRNNILTTLDGQQGVFRLFQRSTTALGPDLVWLYSNTFWRVSGTGNLIPISIESGSTNTTAKNNLAYRTGTAGCTVVNNAGTGTVTASNTSNALCTTAKPWAAATPVVPIDFKPTSVTNGIANGTAALIPGVLKDLFGISRSTPNDLGAVNH